MPCVNGVALVYLYPLCGVSVPVISFLFSPPWSHEMVPATTFNLLRPQRVVPMYCYLLPFSPTVGCSSLLSNIFNYFTVSLPFSARDVSTAIRNHLQTTTARWRHCSHSTTYSGSRLKKIADSSRNVTGIKR